jgi:protein TonB
MKTFFNGLLSLILLSGLTLFAQEKEVDEMPFPVGGIEEIAQNVTYPETAKENKIEGKVFIKAVIDEKGNVESAEVVESLSEECDDAALSAVKKTKFTPGIKDGKNVKCKVTIPVMFKLSEKTE